MPARHPTVWRVFTACCLVGIWILLFHAPSYVTQAVLTGVGARLYWEWVSVVQVNLPAPFKFAYLLCFLMLLWAMPEFAWHTGYQGGAVALFWLSVAWYLPVYPHGGYWNTSKPRIGFLWSCVGMWLIAGFTAVLYSGFYRVGLDGWLPVAGLVIAADTGAYSMGKYAGRRGLCPSISPGKTQEGLYGGMWVALLFWLGVGIQMKPSAVVWVSWAGWGLVLWALSVLGDLLQSALKRKAGVKDSGNWLPGHGGVWDRLDSWLPTVVLWMSVVSPSFQGQ